MPNQSRRFPRWPLLGFSIAASLLPVGGGIYVAGELILDGNWKLAFHPDRVDSLPLFLHVVGSAVFYALAVIQVWPPLRKRFPGWHRRAGRVALVGGVLGALTATWLTIVHSQVRGDILYIGRIVFGPLWGLFLVLAILAILRRDIAAHRAWSIRAFAVAMPAGTLIFVYAPIVLIFGQVSDTVDEAIQSSAWVLHLAIAEIILRSKVFRAAATHWRGTPTVWRSATNSR